MDSQLGKRKGEEKFFISFKESIIFFQPISNRNFLIEYISNKRKSKQKMENKRKKILNEIDIFIFGWSIRHTSTYGLKLFTVSSVLPISIDDLFLHRLYWLPLIFIWYSFQFLVSLNIMCEFYFNSCRHHKLMINISIFRTIRRGLKMEKHFLNVAKLTYHSVFSKPHNTK